MMNPVISNDTFVLILLSKYCLIFYLIKKKFWLKLKAVFNLFVNDESFHKTQYLVNGPRLLTKKQ